MSRARLGWLPKAVPPRRHKLDPSDRPSSRYLVTRYHLADSRNAFSDVEGSVDAMNPLAVLVRVLYTRRWPWVVPTKTCLPDGSNRATVLTDL